MDTETEPLRVMALHALAYCERLFYLEEVEELRVADERVYAGRRLHLQWEAGDDEDGDWRQLTLESDALGLRGKLDALRRRDGAWVVYEHKRGRSCAADDGPAAWESDRLQVIAYAALLEEALGEPVTEGRVRYHADHRLVRVPIGADERQWLREAIARARALRASLERPPVTAHERRCLHCSLAPVCLPEEERLLADTDRQPLRLFPERREERTVHLTEPGARVGRSGDALTVTQPDGAKTRLPIHALEQLVLHGYVQLTTQALTLCVEQGVGVHWLRPSGQYLAGVAPGAGQVQRRLRQYEALRDPDRALALACALVEAKLQHQLGFLLRATRGEQRAQPLEESIAGLRQSLRLAAQAADADALRGHEGMGARHYFAALSWQAEQRGEPLFAFDGRSRRPPRDRFNALLSFGYALLYRDCVAAALAVGLDPALGFFHRPRTAAYPLALDLQELFRVSMVDMPTLGALHRGAFDPHEDFQATPGGVWLTDTGRKKAITTYERRKEDTWKHPVLNYSLSYARLIELEARLLEKEWTGSPGLFARLRLR